MCPERSRLKKSETLEVKQIRRSETTVDLAPQFLEEEIEARKQKLGLSWRHRGIQGSHGRGTLKVDL